MKEELEQQNLDKYEADQGFTLEFLKPQLAIDINRKTMLDDFRQAMLEREALVLELLIQEGYFECGGKLDETAPNDIIPLCSNTDYRTEIYGVRGIEAVLQYATRNKYHLSPEQVQDKANEINQEFGRFDPEKRH